LRPPAADAFRALPRGVFRPKEKLMNMHYAFITATATAIACAAATPAMAQTETTETTTTTTVTKGHHQYIYYGDHDIYFAPETKTYYWREGSSWQSGIELPPPDREYIKSGGVKIELDTDRPYERNEWVIEHYKHGHPVHDDDDDDDGDGH
jgi:hypothetical protein